MNARDGRWIWDSGAAQGLLEARGVWKCKESLFYGFIYSDGRNTDDTHSPFARRCTEVISLFYLIRVAQERTHDHPSGRSV